MRESCDLGGLEATGGAVASPALEEEDTADETDDVEVVAEEEGTEFASSLNFSTAS